MGTIDYVQMSTECLTGSLTVSSTLARGYILARSRQYSDIGKSTAADRRSVLRHKVFIFYVFCIDPNYIHLMNCLHSSSPSSPLAAWVQKAGSLLPVLALNMW